MNCLRGGRNATLRNFQKRLYHLTGGETDSDDSDSEDYQPAPAPAQLDDDSDSEDYQPAPAPAQLDEDNDRRGEDQLHEAIQWKAGILMRNISGPGAIRPIRHQLHIDQSHIPNPPEWPDEDVTVQKRQFEDAAASPSMRRLRSEHKKPVHGNVLNVASNTFVSVGDALRTGHVLNISPYKINDAFLILVTSKMTQSLYRKPHAPCAYRPLIPLHQRPQFPASKQFLKLGTLFGTRVVAHESDIASLQSSAEEHKFGIYRLELEERNAPMYDIVEYYQSTPHQFKAPNSKYQYDDIGVLRPSHHPDAIQVALMRYSNRWDEAMNAYLKYKSMNYTPRSIWGQDDLRRALDGIRSDYNTSYFRHMSDTILRKEVVNTIKLLVDNNDEHGTVNNDPTLVVWRGKSTKINASDLVDGVYTVPGFMSTSLSKEYAMRFTKDMKSFSFIPTGPILKIHVPIGAKYYDMMLASTRGSELELLFLPGTKLQLVSGEPGSMEMTFKVILEDTVTQPPPTKCQLYDRISVESSDDTSFHSHPALTMDSYTQTVSDIRTKMHVFIDPRVGVDRMGAPHHINLQTLDDMRIKQFLQTHKSEFKDPNVYKFDVDQFRVEV